jgi:hypothetical protein
MQRGLTPVDVAPPEIREWLIRRDIEMKNLREDRSPKNNEENLM